MRRISQADTWGEIVVVPLLLAREDSREIRGSPQSGAEPGIKRGEWQRVFEGVLIFVAQAEVNSEILPKMPGILDVRGVGCEKRESNSASEHLVNGSPTAGEIVDEVGQPCESLARVDNDFTSVVDRTYISNC